MTDQHAGALPASERAPDEAVDAVDDRAQTFERLNEGRKAGEMESGMASGSDEEPAMYVGDRYVGEMTREEAEEAMDDILEAELEREGQPSER